MKKKFFVNSKFIVALAVVVSMMQAPSAIAFNDFAEGYDSYNADLADLYEGMSGFEEDDDDYQPRVAIVDKPTSAQENFTSEASAEEYNENVRPKFELGSTILKATATENWPDQLSIFKAEGLKFERGPIKSVKLGFMYNGSYTTTFPYNDRSTGKWKDDLMIASLETRFRDDKTSFKFAYNFYRKMDNAYRFFNQINEVYVMHKFNKHNRVIIGQGPRLPIGIEGSVGAFGSDLPTRAYIGRTFGNTRSIGVRYQGNFKYADLDLAVTDARRYMRSYGGGEELVGWVNFKPLAGLDPKKWGKLTIGTGIDTGSSLEHYSVWGAYIGYDYKRFHNKFEYAYADGWNGGTSLPSAKISDGFYDTIIFDLTDKWQLLGRIDCYNTDRNSKKDTNNIEYTAGLTYKISKNMRLLGSYTYKVKPGKDPQEQAHAVAVQIRINI